MGNGRKYTPDVPKAPPYAAHRSLAAELGLSSAKPFEAHTGPGGTPLAIDFCEQTHRLEIELRSGVVPALDETVRVVLGPVPRVVDTDGADIGAVTARQTAAIRQCLMDDYIFFGAITAVSPSDGTAEITVAGVRRE